MMKPNLVERVRQVYDRLGLLPLSVIQLMARFSMAITSGVPARPDCQLGSDTAALANEYKVPILPPGSRRRWRRPSSFRPRSCCAGSLHPRRDAADDRYEAGDPDLRLSASGPIIWRG